MNRPFCPPVLATLLLVQLGLLACDGEDGGDQLVDAATAKPSDSDPSRPQRDAGNSEPADVTTEAADEGPSTVPSASTADAGGQGCEPECGPSTADFFDNSRLASLHITVDPKETKAAGYGDDEWLELMWERWSVCAEHPHYTKVTMQYESPDGIGDAVLDNVGMRLRGTKSRGSNDLQGFKLNYQTLLDDSEDPSDRGDNEGDAGTDSPRRRFADMNQLNALSIEADKSLMLQCAAYKYVRNFGIPAPRCNHLKVFVNGEFYGLLQNVEKVDDGRFLRHYFGTTKGALYEGSGGCSRELEDGTVVQFPDALATLEYKGDTFTGDYLSAYNPLRGDPRPEAELIPMLKCGDETETPDDEDFRSCIQDWINVDEWLRLIAAESIMPTLESFMVPRNYHLYFHPDLEVEDSPHGGHFMLYSWDYDTALNKQGCPATGCDVFSGVTGFQTGHTRPPLALRLMRVFKQETCDTMYRFLDEVYSVDVIDEMAASVEAAVLEIYDEHPEKAVYAEGDWQQAITDMHDFVANRALEARRQIDAECAASGVGDAGGAADAGPAATLDAATLDAAAEAGSR